MSLRPNAFLRSKLQNENTVEKLIEKLSVLAVKKPNAFQVDFKGQKFLGEKMTNLDFSALGLITFTYEAADYELSINDVLLVKRIRCRKYQFKTNVLTDVTV